MTDTEHANAIEAARRMLMDAIRAAEEAGLLVRVRIPKTVSGETVVGVTATRVVTPS